MCYIEIKKIMVLVVVFMTMNTYSQNLITNGDFETDPPTRPNIVFIVTDDLGIRDLGCYGSEYYLTPTLDALASEGMRFTNAYSASNVCSPTRASILTGQYPHRVHITDALPWDRLYENPKMVPPNHLKELPSTLPNYAKSLRSAGYKTALFGKWHLGNEYNFYAKEGYKAYGFDEAFAVSGVEKKKDKGVDKLTERCIQFLKANKEVPFVLTLMHHTPHVPLESPQEYKDLYNEIPKGQNQNNQTYAGMISHLDHSVKVILDKLDELELAENTVVIFTSDNGGLRTVTSNKPYRGAKGNLYEGGTRVPLIVRWPGHVLKNSVCDAIVNSVDYFPTFLALAGIDMSAVSLDGIDMLPLLKGETLEERTCYWHFPHRSTPSSSVLDNNWKLVHKIVPDTYELFDLKTYPYETKNLSSKNTEEANRLKLLLKQHLKDSGAQRMRSNTKWDRTQPKGEVRNFGIFYNSEGSELQMVTDPYPDYWFYK